MQENGGKAALAAIDSRMAGLSSTSGRGVDEAPALRRGAADQRTVKYHVGFADVLAVEEELREVQGRVGNLSPRGESQMVSLDSESSFVTTLNLKPSVITSALHQEGACDMHQSRKKGTRVHFPSDRTLCSRVISSKNSFSALSDD